MRRAADRLARGRRRPRSAGSSRRPSPLVWALTGEGEAQDRQARRIAAALGWPFVEKRLAYGPLAGLRGRLPGATAGILDPAGSAPLAPPWPDVLITSGKRSAAGGALDPPPVRRPHPAGPARPARRAVLAVRPDRRHARRPAADPRQRAAGGGTARPRRRRPTAPRRRRSADLPRPVTALFLRGTGVALRPERSRRPRELGRGRERGGRAAWRLARGPRPIPRPRPSCSTRCASALARPARVLDAARRRRRRAAGRRRPLHRDRRRRARCWPRPASTGKPVAAVRAAALVRRPAGDPAAGRARAAAVRRRDLSRHAAAAARARAASSTG